MKGAKKLIRNAFKEAVFMRDNFRCVKCGYNGEQERSAEWRAKYRTNVLDAHHITDRHEMPDGGYVVENGITLCDECHLKAEMFHATGKSFPGYSPEDLYAAIGSSKELAVRKSNECLQEHRSNKV
jgi:DNA-directed RNA polymerase subunit M/transcription elongation factor TFIIS